MHAEEPDQLEETCSLDVADRGGISETEVARLVGRVKDRRGTWEFLKTIFKKLRKRLPPELADSWAHPKNDDHFEPDVWAQYRAHRPELSTSFESSEPSPAESGVRIIDSPESIESILVAHEGNHESVSNVTDVHSERSGPNIFQGLEAKVSGAHS
jgi:hypothetical protein